MPFDDLLAPLFAKVQLFDGLTRAEFGPPLKRHHTGAQKAQICRGIRGGVAKTCCKVTTVNFCRIQVSFIFGNTPLKGVSLHLIR